MYVTLNTILKHPVFRDAKYLTAIHDVTRNIKRVSVFDCPIPADIFQVKIVERGDFFLSSLRQFKGTGDFFEFIKLLIKLESSGLCAAANNAQDFMTNEIRSYCDHANFPIIQVDENIPYAYLMDTINRFLSIENLNAINQLKLDKIRLENLSEKEKLDLLHSMNVNLKRFLKVICLTGNITSEIGAHEWSIEFLNSKQDIYVDSRGTKTLIISAEIEEKLEQHAQVIKEKLHANFKACYLGISRIHASYDIDKALEEAEIALSAAKNMQIPIQEYHPLSTMQLLISMKDSRELSEYYSSYIQKIKAGVSENNLEEILRTVEIFVFCHGDYKQTGERINQHENTVRYRINKIKSILELEDEPIAFHECISLAVRAGLLLKGTPKAGV